MRSEWALRSVADMRLRPWRGLISGMGFGATDFGGRPRRGVPVAVAITPGFLGGLPRRFRGPWRASMARFSRSRSAVSNARMSLVTVLMVAWLETGTWR